MDFVVRFWDEKIPKTDLVEITNTIKYGALTNPRHT
jgi:hypothetical protein